MAALETPRMPARSPTEVPAKPSMRNRSSARPAMRLSSPPASAPARSFTLSSSMQLVVSADPGALWTGLLDDRSVSSLPSYRQRDYPGLPGVATAREASDDASTRLDRPARGIRAHSDTARGSVRGDGVGDHRTPAHHDADPDQHGLDDGRRRRGTVAGDLGVHPAERPARGGPLPDGGRRDPVGRGAHVRRVARRAAGP